MSHLPPPDTKDKELFYLLCTRLSDFFSIITTTFLTPNTNRLTHLLQLLYKTNGSHLVMIKKIKKKNPTNFSLH